MSKRSSYAMETNQKDSRTTRQVKTSTKNRSNDYDHDRKFHSTTKKDKYKTWKQQAEEYDWDE